MDLNRDTGVFINLVAVGSSLFSLMFDANAEQLTRFDFSSMPSLSDLTPVRFPPLKLNLIAASDVDGGDIKMPSIVMQPLVDVWIRSLLLPLFFHPTPLLPITFAFADSCDQYTNTSIVIT